MEEDRQLCFNKMMFTSCNKSIHQTTKGKLIWQHESGILPISMAVMCFMLMIQLCEFVCECKVYSIQVHGRTDPWVQTGFMPT